MRLLLTLSLLCVLISPVAAEHNQLTPEQIHEGWISLFDGETLFGWEKVADVDWHVVDGEICATKGETGLLATTTDFADYELHVEFRIVDEKTVPLEIAGEKIPGAKWVIHDTHSGVFIRSALFPTDPAKDCVEVNIAPTNDLFPTGNFVGRGRSAVNVDPPTSPGDWHSFLIRAVGSIVSVTYDGKPYLTGGHETVPKRGRIGLQFDQGKIAFRNIRLKPLGTQPIFNEKDLTGWNTARAEASRFQVTSNGELQVLNGRGQLESDAAYGDFLLQLECFVNGDALNSGIFFRCIPGDFMMGYECQIHNGTKDNDQPADCGTGGFFRRQDARCIVAKDREWFAMTLIADGPHMAAWIDGHQVSDWTDMRKPHENPRKGLRLEPGTLAIQGHDPTTDLRFRNLRIVELPK